MTTSIAEKQFELATFSDVDCIKGLIKNRLLIDPYYNNEVNYNIYESGNVKPVNQEIICLYADLDNLIKETRLSDKQKYIVNRLMDGYSEEDLAEEFNQRVGQIEAILHSACEKMRDVHIEKWKYDYIYLNYLRVKWDYKQCSKCRKNKPKINEFFSPDIRNRDGFHSICRNCR